MTTEKDDKWFQQLQLYMQGKLGEDETRDLQRKVMVSEDLSNKLESLLFTDLLSSPGESDGDRSLSVEQQQRIMRKSKWRSRFSQLFFTTGGIAACIAILLIVSQVANYVWFWPAAKHIQRVLDDVVSFTQPALRVGSGGTNGGLLFSMDMKYTLEEQLGREDKLAGYVKNSVSPLQSHLSFQWNNGYRRNLLFFHYPYPGQPQQNANGIHVFDQAWRTLDRLPEGTVSQLAVSFDHLMTPEEVVALLKNADVEITWLALATGQEEAEGEQAVLGKGAVWGYNPKAHELGTKGAVH
ncbi:MAG: anti sigma factor C-terminal domain-containing protein, partial [Clostridia bacterium]